MLYHAAEIRRQKRIEAGLIDAVAVGYGGMRSQSGFKHLRQRIAALMS